MDYITKPKEMTAENQRKMIFSLKKAYPMLRVGVIGKSLCQRGIFSLSIGKSENPLLIAAAFHGQEWLTSLLALRFAELLLCSKTCGAPLWGISAAGITREVIIIPCVNPDGVQIAINGVDGAGRYAQTVAETASFSNEKWSANARGVDINHNFDAGWHELRNMEIESGILGPSPRRYGGYMAESEPETAALTAFCKARRPRTAIALHSQGEEIDAGTGHGGHGGVDHDHGVAQVHPHAARGLLAVFAEFQRQLAARQIHGKLFAFHAFLLLHVRDKASLAARRCYHMKTPSGIFKG